MKLNKEESKRRILGRQLVKEIPSQDLKEVTGGTTSCSNCTADDCDIQAF